MLASNPNIDGLYRSILPGVDSESGRKEIEERPLVWNRGVKCRLELN
jgi:hypothetical protein